jgi:hypothetical protein
VEFFSSQNIVGYQIFLGVSITLMQQEPVKKRASNWQVRILFFTDSLSNKNGINENGRM